MTAALLSDGALSEFAAVSERLLDSAAATGRVRRLGVLLTANLAMAERCVTLGARQRLERRALELWVSIGQLAAQSTAHVDAARLHLDRGRISARRDHLMVVPAGDTAEPEEVS